MTGDPGALLGPVSMHRLQIAIVALCIGLNALDGFDVLAISFASPGIAAEWGIDRAQLGVVLSMELFGMAAGSVLIGNVADRIGRRPTILGCLAVMMIGMFAAMLANNVVHLSVARLFTGVGIGGMLSSTSALVSEFSNDRRHNLNVALNISGYSAGAILGGLIVSALLATSNNWRLIFGFGGLVTALMLPLAFFLLQESIDYLVTRRPARALERVNHVLSRLGREPWDALPPPPAEPQRSSIPALFSSDYAATTILLAVAYFTQIMLFYFILKWVPKIIVDMGFTPAQAAGVLVFANIGNLMGALLVGLAAQRFQPRRLLVAAMIVAFFIIGLFGVGFQSLALMSLILCLAGLFINAGVVGLYPIMAHAYPARLRATGTGFIIGMGRGGSALGPIVVGLLFTSGASLMAVSLTMGAGALVAATMLVLLPRSGVGTVHPN
jgi:benzoate transport